MEAGTEAACWTTRTSHRRDSLGHPPTREAPPKLSSQHLQQMFPNFLGKSVVSGWVHGMCQGWSWTLAEEKDRGSGGAGLPAHRGPSTLAPWCCAGKGLGLRPLGPVVLPSPQGERLHLGLQVETNA